MVTLSKITTVYVVLAVNSLEGRLRRFGGIPGAFSGSGLASALWSVDWPTSATSLPQIVFLASFLLLIAAINGGSGIGELAGAKRALGF